jgi:hypothetical protein
MTPYGHAISIVAREIGAVIDSACPAGVPEDELCVYVEAGKVHIPSELLCTIRLRGTYAQLLMAATYRLQYLTL